MRGVLLLITLAHRLMQPVAPQARGSAGSCAAPDIIAWGRSAGAGFCYGRFEKQRVIVLSLRMRGVLLPPPSRAPLRGGPLRRRGVCLRRSDSLRSSSRFLRTQRGLSVAENWISALRMLFPHAMGFCWL